MRLEFGDAADPLHREVALPLRRCSIAVSAVGAKLADPKKRTFIRGPLVLNVSLRRNAATEGLDHPDRILCDT